MLGSVFSLPRDVTFGHSRQWRTMKGPTTSWADMVECAGQWRNESQADFAFPHVTLHFYSLQGKITMPVPLVLCLHDDSGVRRYVELEG
jgi:hypothetical protein